MLTRRHAFLEHPGTKAFAHRGGTSHAPENTLSAFAAAVDAGYTYLETDVHLTADGVLVAFHDERLDRATDSSGLISELTWDEVRSALVDGREPVPLFEDILMTWPHARINIDPKADSTVDTLAALLRRTRALERVCVGSFSDARLRRLRGALGSGLCTSAGPRTTGRLIAASRGIKSGKLPADAVQVPVSHKGVTIVTSAFVETAHEMDVEVHVWTIDDPVEMHRLLDLGVDGIMTDLPLVLRDVLIERDDWWPPPPQDGSHDADLQRDGATDDIAT